MNNNENSAVASFIMVGIVLYSVKKTDVTHLDKVLNIKNKYIYTYTYTYIYINFLVSYVYITQYTLKGVYVFV